jgi:hypothetical protein
MTWPTKDPDEVVDYSIDWTARLESDTIVASSWIVPSGITRNSDSFTPTSTTIWLQGGTDGAAYSFVNRVITAGGRTFDQTEVLQIADH